MKAISTQYKGYLFRSRLEARWGVFLDALGIAWDYEAEGFEIEGERYLPDFWLPTVKMWAEVKPDKLNAREKRVARGLAREGGHCILQLVGIPDCGTYWAIRPDEIEDEYCLTNFKGRFYASPGGGDTEWPDTAFAAFRARSARFEFGETP